MTGFPFDPARLAALSRLADSINGEHAPPPIVGGVDIDGDWVSVPVPDHGQPGFEREQVSTFLHAGLTLQWSPMPEQGGLILSLWGGSPDGDQDKDGLACFLTRRGLGVMIRDLQAISAAIGGEA